MEKDNELKANNNSYDFGARIYDNRLGRFMSVDSEYSKFPENSTYLYASNNPIIYIDVDGNGPEYFVQSITISKTIKAQLRKLESGKICFHDFQGKIDKHSNKIFTNVPSGEYIKRRFSEGGIAMHLSETKASDTKYDGYYHLMPFITAKPESYKTFDAIVTVNIVEEGKNGKLVQSTFKIVDPDRQSFLESYYPMAILATEMKLIGVQGEIAELRSKMQRIELSVDNYSEENIGKGMTKKGRQDGSAGDEVSSALVQMGDISDLQSAKEKWSKLVAKSEFLKGEIKDLKKAQKENADLKGKTTVK
jgi:RHS repeat-associated protein